MNQHATRQNGQSGGGEGVVGAPGAGRAGVLESAAGRGFLLASALVLAGLLVSHLGGVWGAAPAWGDLVAQRGDFVALTVDGGTDDVLVVLDQRAESLMVYHVANQQSLVFKGRQDLRELFYQARRVTVGGMGGGPGAK